MKPLLALFVILVAGISNNLLAQSDNVINGFVYSIEGENKLTPLLGVHIKIINSDLGTISSSDGLFTLTTNE